MRTLFITLSFLVAISLWATSYTPTDAYAIKFSTSKAEGTFRGFTGRIDFDADDLGSANFDVSVDASTISTGNKTKDKHARGDKWLDAEQHPRISFKSTRFEQTSDGYLVSGSLSIRGISKEVSIPFTFKENVFSGTTSIQREDFGIEGPFLFGGMVGDEIAVSLQIPVVE